MTIPNPITEELTARLVEKLRTHVIENLDLLLGGADVLEIMDDFVEGRSALGFSREGVAIIHPNAPEPDDFRPGTYL
ncbi:hypothetical protein [Streptomyces fulvoviolaceus]|uniref:hypothetical protein n=1 Tax=Streptomyces fulvoviolaceus TaxID=285535 RepID=UPI0004C644CE|nr:hypothetical protein [Streptomyces fulvoviolaceus]